MVNTDFVLDEFTIDLRGTLAQRDDDYWIAKIPDLGPFAYGSTPEEARSRVLHLAGLLLSHWVEIDVATERLRAAGIPFSSTRMAATLPAEWSASHKVLTHPPAAVT